MSASRSNPFIIESSLPIQFESYPFIDPKRFAGKLKGKVALITGASGGLGKATTYAFAAAGANIACVARRKAELETLAEDLKSRYNILATAIEADVADPDDPNIASKIVEKATRDLGPIDILINNAGTTRMGALGSETDFSVWWRVLEVNLRGSVALTHAVLGPMIERKKGGIVISVASRAGVMDFSYATAYGSSKAALIKFHQDLSIELERHNILSFSTHPGLVKTDLGTRESVVNPQSVVEEPGLQQVFDWASKLGFQSENLMADTCVTLCADERCRILNGRYIDCEQPLDKIVEEAEREGGGRVGNEKLYWLKMDYM